MDISAAELESLEQFWITGYYKITKLAPFLFPFLLSPSRSLQTRKPDWKPQLMISKEYESFTSIKTPAWWQIMPSWFTFTLKACKQAPCMSKHESKNTVHKIVNQPDVAFGPKAYSFQWNFGVRIQQHPWQCLHLWKIEETLYRRPSQTYKP